MTLKLNNILNSTNHRIAMRQRGSAVVELAIISILFFGLLFGIIEFGRLFYVYNSVQEVTRRAARIGVVVWVQNINDPVEITAPALFYADSWPAGAEISSDKLKVSYLKSDFTPISALRIPVSAESNVLECLYPTGNFDCIAFVKVSIAGAFYRPMMGLFSDYLNVPIPESSVIMPAESMGYSS